MSPQQRKPPPPHPAGADQVSAEAKPTTGERLFISDLHLSPQRPALTRLFIEFLEQRAPRASELYILGDLFDAWIGDDDDPLPEVRLAFQRLTAQHRRCLVMHGNRDFLLGRRFARTTGCELIPDPCLIQLSGEPVLLMHGDGLCTDDLAYQRFRRRVRNPIAQQLFLWSPLSKRRRIAASYRQRSKEAMMAKPEEIMDVNDSAVIRQMRRFKVRRLIHGHTHRPRDHLIHLDGQPVLRQVLSDWHDDCGEILVYQAGSWRREPWSRRP
ncbi:MAG: UDP-2,3-diacylglucosamine diphosphatase [Lamprobacter sp.]|uniref:UDP-2,3-diacylglucosamine diphosphatase n=1 Tax=Lamprobacter sp. TaxID=3100796 RepID=UPI002B25CD75|nr:UDP-2,3-diacylglucosamine diphosphatase [Lamprobacter sp.]MEA3639321.1 UDP-2,3-diacylglucosamine diphosphatase [Lamprobacter sp.]